MRMRKSASSVVAIAALMSAVVPTRPRAATAVMKRLAVMVFLQDPLRCGGPGRCSPLVSRPSPAARFRNQCPTQIGQSFDRFELGGIG